MILYNCRLIIFSILALIFAACSPVKYINISILEPAEIILPPKIKNVSILSRINERNSPAGRLDSINNIKLNTWVNYYSLTKNYLFGIADIIDESPRLNKVVIPDTNDIFSNNGDFNYNWTDIIKLCKHDSTDAVILINNFYLTDSLNLESVYEIFCYATFKLENHIEWIILFPEGFKVVSNDTFSYSLYWKELDYSCNGALNLLPSGEDMISELCYETGRQIARKLVPIWNDNVERIYYLYGNKLMNEGSKYAKNGMWIKAAEAWRKVTNSENTKLAAKAAFNMALACEMEDKIDVANDWINYSDSIYSTKYSQAYKQLLLNRLRQAGILDKQMGVTR